ncbi:MAG: hypothetical protein ABSG31_17005 [Tepidisphaeraceae bacterium]|jgi:hypothetical protein
MIDPGDIQEQLDKVPFEPFRMRLVNGVHYDVEHADSITLMDRYAFFAPPKSGWFILDYGAIVSLESLRDD